MKRRASGARLVPALVVLSLARLAAQNATGLTDVLSPTQSLGQPEFFASPGEFIVGDQVARPAGTAGMNLSNAADRTVGLASSPSLVVLPEFLVRFRFDGNDLVLRVLRSGDETRVAGWQLSEIGPSGPVRIREFRQDQSLLQTKTYQYSPDGRVHSVRTSNADGEQTQVLSYLWSDGNLKEERSWTPTRTEIRRFSPDGRVQSTVAQTASGLEETLRRYDSEGRYVGRTLRYPETEPIRRVETDFDDEGRDGEVREYLGEELLRRTTYAYDGSSTRVRELRVEAGEQVQVQRSEYQDEELVRVEYLRNGTITQISNYDGENRVDSLYRSGQEVLRVHYRNEIRVKEEELSNGQVIRTRIVNARGGS